MTTALRSREPPLAVIDLTHTAPEVLAGYDRAFEEQHCSLTLSDAPLSMSFFSTTAERAPPQ